ncbi:MAG: hypothetical protein SFX18_00640 [Pirellulales bacterium]|nr:hypothetical protein [Pirellulales bacterium]
MQAKFRFGVLLAGLATMATGCHLPHNAPGEHAQRLRPLVTPHTNVLPPAQMLMHPGPGVDGPGPGVFMTGSPTDGGGAGCNGQGASSQIGFVGMDGMKVTWDVTTPGAFDSAPLIFPGRYNFGQGAIYRLKLTDIPGNAGVELYPTLEVAPTTPRTEAFLAHNYIPFQLTNEDFAQVLSGNFVTKVIYLPDAEHQELALAGVETLVSTRLDPGLDPIVEADRKGSILAIIRVGNKDLQAPGGNGAGMVVPLGYAAGAGACGPNGDSCGPNGGSGGGLQAFMAGVTAPSYGMPITGTPIGLPGPAHIPLGHPAGLQQHVMRNHTHMHIPGPTEKLKINVAQRPGLSYPAQPHHVRIIESNRVPHIPFVQPKADKTHILPGEWPPVRTHHGGAAVCDDGNCDPSSYSTSADCEPGATVPAAPTAADYDAE